MSKIIDEIVADLISLDPEFAKIEKEIRVLAQKMLAAKPRSEIDANFKKSLKNELLARAAQLKSAPSKLSFNPFKMQKFFYSLAGAAVALAILFGVQNYNRIVPSSDSVAEFTVQSVEPRAFGSLVADSNTAPAAGKGGGGGGAAGVTLDMARGGQMMGEYTITKFIYDGPITFPVGTVDVLKRVKNNVSSGSLLSSLANFNFGLADFSSLQNLKLQNFGFAEDRDRGYLVYVDAEGGSVSISQNWQNWPNVYAACGVIGAAPDCYQKLQLKESEMLSDADNYKIAADFVQRFSINLNNYGAPEIVSPWREELARTTDKENFYFPEAISVVYPLEVSGKKVYTDGGWVEGVNIAVDQRLKLATSVWNLQTQQYQSSAYAAVTDEALFRKFLENGGIYSWYPEDTSNARIIEVTLGDPEMVWLRYSNFQNGQNDDLLVPALKFPVVKIPDGEYVYQKAIIVPLAAEILADRNSNPPILYSDVKPVDDSVSTDVVESVSVESSDCPQLTPPAPDFCPNGQIVSAGLDARGCQQPPVCEAVDTVTAVTPTE